MQGGMPTTAPQPPGLIWLSPLNAWLERWLSYVAGTCLSVLVVVVFIDVLFRQVINEPLLWPSEIAVLVFVWSVLSGAAVSARRRAHFVVDVVPAGLPVRLEFVLRLAVVLFSMLFAFTILYFGAEVAQTGLKRFTPMKGYPMIFHFSAFPIAGAAILLFVTEHLLEVLAGHDSRTRIGDESTPDREGEGG